LHFSTTRTNNNFNKMFTGGNFKSFVASAALLLALAAQANAHAAPVPALGVAKPARSDVQRPSTNAPCGNVNIAQTLDSSTATAAGADGSVTIGVQNFNAGADGSTSVSVQVDATGKGTSFVAGTVTKNGQTNPTKTGTDQVTFSLPAGTKCTGGAAGNLCLVSVKTTAGFGACTVVSQGAAAAGGAAAGGAAAGGAAAGGAATAPAAGNANTGAANTGAANTGAAAGTGAAATTGKGRKGGKGRGRKGAAAKAAAAKAAAQRKQRRSGRFAPHQLRAELVEEMMQRRGAALE